MSARRVQLFWPSASSASPARLVIAGLQRWTCTDWLLSEVASYLTLKEIVRVLTTLRSRQPLVGEGTFAPSTWLIRMLVGRAAKSQMSISLQTLRWTHPGNTSSQHNQMVGTRELRMLHYLISSTPHELRSIQFGQQVLDALGPYNAKCYCPYTEEQGRQLGARTICKLTASIAGGCGVEVAVAGRRCSQATCCNIVLRNCPACKDVSCSCSRHAATCSACKSLCCPGCIVPNNVPIQPQQQQQQQQNQVPFLQQIAQQQPQQQQQQQQQKLLCSTCAFQCISCRKAKPTARKYQCSAGAACSSPHNLCLDCVHAGNGGAVPTRVCNACQLRWCTPCGTFPACMACENTLCADCAEMTQCSRCLVVAHGEDCMYEIGSTCEFCSEFVCHGCMRMDSCSSCEVSFCTLCEESQVVSCPEEHKTCSKYSLGQARTVLPRLSIGRVLSTPSSPPPPPPPSLPLVRAQSGA